ncbi:MAG TPA: hypothetical protein VNQ14_10350, partial [Woeseiaceae bacterium]|nr:hypothetical protein [Woeseiaceae bacterium]
QMKHIPSLRVVAIPVCTSLLLAHTVLADITLQEQFSVKGEGLMSFANMSGTSTTVIANDKASMQGEVKMESRLARMVAGKLGNTADIVRLDQGKLYQLDMEERRYNEISLADQRAELEKAMEQAREAQQQQPMPVDESQCDWSEPVTEVTRGGSESIAGFDAEQLKIAATQSCTDRSTGQVCDFSITLEQWLAPEFSDEAATFYRSYAEQLGFDASGSGEITQRAETLLSRYPDLLAEVAKEAGGVEGYPVRSRFALAIGGPQCEQGKENAGVTAADVGESVAGVGGRLVGSLFKKRKKEEPAAAAAQDSGMIQLLAVSSELVAVSEETADPAAFEVPAGFTRTNEVE